MLLIHGLFLIMKPTQASLLCDFLFVDSKEFMYFCRNKAVWDHCVWQSGFIGSCAANQKLMLCELLLSARFSHTLYPSMSLTRDDWKPTPLKIKEAFHWEASHHLILYAVCTPKKAFLCVCVWFWTGRARQIHGVRHSLQTVWLHPKKILAMGHKLAWGCIRSAWSARG